MQRYNSVPWDVKRHPVFGGKLTQWRATPQSPKEWRFKEIHDCPPPFRGSWRGLLFNTCFLQVCKENSRIARKAASKNDLVASVNRQLDK
jgi:hypothetical protein